jgi:hypothetical protein
LDEALVLQFQHEQEIRFFSARLGERVQTRAQARVELIHFPESPPPAGERGIRNL